MSWGLVAKAALSIGSSVASSYLSKDNSGDDSGGGGGTNYGGNLNDAAAGLDFKTDEYFTKGQEDLYGFGSGMLKGNLPEFYEGLGKTGSKEFNDMLSLVNRDTATAVNENLVRRNIKGGVGLSSIAKATADAGTKMRWADYIKASGEKQELMKTGLETVSGVRGAGLTYGGQQNQFGLNKASLSNNFALGKAGLALKQQQIANAQASEKGGLWSQIMESGVGAITSLVGNLGSSKGTSSTSSSNAGAADTYELNYDPNKNYGASKFA